MTEEVIEYAIKNGWNEALLQFKVPMSIIKNNIHNMNYYCFKILLSEKYSLPKDIEKLALYDIATTNYKVKDYNDYAKFTIDNKDVVEYLKRKRYGAVKLVNEYSDFISYEVVSSYIEMTSDEVIELAKIGKLSFITVSKNENAILDKEFVISNLGRFDKEALSKYHKYLGVEFDYKLHSIEAEYGKNIKVYTDNHEINKDVSKFIRDHIKSSIYYAVHSTTDRVKIDTTNGDSKSFNLSFQRGFSFTSVSTENTRNFYKGQYVLESVVDKSVVRFYYEDHCDKYVDQYYLSRVVVSKKNRRAKKSNKILNFINKLLT